MKRKYLDKGQEDINIPRLYLITALLFIGGCIGSYYGAEALKPEAWIRSFFDMSPQSFFRWEILINLSLLLCLFVFGFASAGFIPAMPVIAAKGFLTAMQVSVCIRLYGIGGYYLVLKNCGVCSFLSVFSMILMAMQSIEMSSLKRGDKIKADDNDIYKMYMLTFFLCAAAVIFGAAVDGFVL